MKKKGTICEVSAFSWSFWDLVLQKLVRNLASMKFQFLLLLYIPIIYGLFEGQWINGQWVSKIPAMEGLAFLGGGYVTLALGRIYAKTKLRNGNTDQWEEIDTDE